MCSCQQHSNSTTEAAAKPMDNGVSFRVNDMTCGHCAGTIKKAIETNFPGASVIADPDSKVVTVRGYGDYSAIESIVIGAGYTPSASPA